MKKISAYNNSSLINIIVSFIFGFILFLNPGGIVEFISYITGIFFIMTGVFNILNYHKTFKNLNIELKEKLISGIILITLGLISIICASAIEALIRIIIGAIILYNGIIRLEMYSKNPTNIVGIIFSIMTIIFGIYIIFRSNLVFSMIGLLIIIYSITELINYIFYKKN